MVTRHPKMLSAFCRGERPNEVWRLGFDHSPEARLLLAHLTASVFIGSILSHFRQTSFVRLSLSVVAINRLLHPGQRLKSIVTSVLEQT
jgi:hypothetical protein